MAKEEQKNLLEPVTNIILVDRDKLKANDYNPNKVSKRNLDLLETSILTNGWTMPIVVKPDYTIIDGYHRWLISGREDIKKMLGGKVPVAIVSHDDHAKDIYGTITHNRARGTHLLEPMKKIVKELLDEGKTVKEISKQLGMKDEEVFRLSDFSREDFLAIMMDGKKKKGYSKAKFIVEI